MNKKLLLGVNKLNNIVKTTIGHKGRNVLIARGDYPPLITNDGVTIARSVRLQNTKEQYGADIIKQASLRTNEMAGDGTTSAIVLASAIINTAKKHLRRGADPNRVKDELIEAGAAAVRCLGSLAKPCNSLNDLSCIAISSCASETDGKMAADAVSRTGENGVVTLEENNFGKTTLTFKEGMEVNLGLLSPYMCENCERSETIYTEAKTLVTTEKIISVKDVIPFLEKSAKEGIPLVIIANDYSPEFIAALLVNRAKLNLRVIALKLNTAENKDAVYEDIAAVTGAVIIGVKNDLTLASAEETHLGTAERIIAGINTTTIIASGTNEERIASIKSQINLSADEYSKSKLKERLAKMTTGIAVISIGCPTEAEQKEKKLRCEDAIRASQSALKDGIVQGGGLTYCEIAKSLPADTLGAKILKKSLPAITAAICKNANLTVPKFVKTLPKTVIDPALVIKNVIINSISAAGILLTTEKVISA
jgi:chaperonin GroEL